MFLWRTNKNYSSIIIKYTPYLFFWWLWGVDWKFRHEGNCLASQGLARDTEQLSRVTEFSICTEQSLYSRFFFLRCDSKEYPQRKFFMKNCRKLSFDYHQIPTFSVPLLLVMRKQNKILNSVLSQRHVVNRLLCEKRKSIPKLFQLLKLFKNVTLQILNFILVS